MYFLLFLAKIVVVSVCVCNVYWWVRLVVFGDTDAMEQAIQDYNDSVLNDRNMKLRKVNPHTPPHTHTHTHAAPPPHTQSRPTRDKKVLQEYQREGGDRRGRRKHSSRDPACSVFVHNVSEHLQKSGANFQSINVC